jgi:TRAP-type C4-dicarboxylate transport system permease small subunit
MDGTVTPTGVLRRVEATICLAIKVVLGVLLSAMIMLVFMNVIFRYFLNNAIAWSEEISRFMMIWVSFLGANIAFVKNEHLGLDLLVRALPKKAAQALVVVADLLVLFAISFIVLGGTSLAQQTLESGWTSPATETPYGLIYLVVPFSGILLFFQGLIKLIENVGVLAGKVSK